MEREEKHTRLSRYISLLLRHKPEEAGLEMDRSGYIKVEELVQGVNNTGRYIDTEILKEIVQTDSKRRYSYNKEQTKIRANQGHSIQVDLGLKATEPNKTLYHGTAQRFQESINKKGLVKGTREYVHLSETKQTAKAVAKRWGKPILYKIDTDRMVQDGYKFYKAKNNVWLTKEVPVKYLKEVENKKGGSL